MDRITDLADRHGLFVLEDVAQALGGTWKEKRLGSIGRCGAFSFFPSKNLGGFGDAGMVATNDDEVNTLVRMLLRHGGYDKYNVDHVGYNGRMDTLQAAVLLAKLGFLDDLNARRRRIAKSYTAGLRNDLFLSLPIDDTGNPSFSAAGTAPSLPVGHVFHQYTVRVEPDRRDPFRLGLHKRGVSTMIYYPYPLHKMGVFADGRGVCGSSLSHAETACATVFSLPMEPLQTEDETEYVIKQINQLAESGQ
jgi:dTDP-4-amino-4,6-dideoxygalactose transaminase